MKHLYIVSITTWNHDLLSNFRQVDFDSYFSAKSYFNDMSLNLELLLEIGKIKDYQMIIESKGVTK